MIEVALYEPEIPPNTGNIIRLCANTGAKLHLIHPLGFRPTDSKLKRAGLDYHEWTKIEHHQDYNSFLNNHRSSRLLACSKFGTRCYTEVDFKRDDILLFGPETRGLPKSLLQDWDPAHVIRIPMLENSRSLNLSNAVAVILYEALRQIGFSMVSLR